MADPVVGITNGVPTSGTGTITTLGQTLLDGANVTIGAKADAKASTSDATPISAVSIWKQISFSIQAAAASLAGTLTVASHAVTNAGTFAVQAAATLAAETTKVIGVVHVGDGTNSAAVKAASTAPVAADPAIVVAISPNGQNVNGLAAAGGSAPTIQASTTMAVAVVPTVTASAYTAGNIMGGIITFAAALDAVRFAGILESIAVKFKGAAVTGNMQLTLFKASPSNGTYGDKTAGTWNAADMANLLGTYQLTAPLSSLGTMTVYNLDGIGKAILGTTQSLFGILTVSGTPTPASTTDLTVELGILPG